MAWYSSASSVISCTCCAAGAVGTCTRSLIPAGIKLRVHVPTAPAAQQVQEMTLDADEYHAIYRLPDTGIVTLEVIDSLGNLVPGASQNIDMATRPALMGGNLWPPYP